MRPLKHIDDPNFTGVIFRRTQEALKKGGSVWPESKKLYRPFETKVNEKDRKHYFKGGAVLAFDGLKDVGDEESNYQGSQFSFIGFDEATHFEESQVIYMIGRLRSDAGNDAYCMLTCNPDPDSWLLKWVQPYLDEEGFPIREKGGQIRYFINIDGNTVFSDTREWLIENHPDHAYVVDDLGNKTEVISTYTFIDGNIYDNPALIRNEPKYLAKLKGQSRVNQSRLLHGNWYAREEGTNYFQREWLIKVPKVPMGARSCRAWDKASESPSEKNRSPDFTACSARTWKDKDGFFYLTWSVDSSICDEGSEVIGQFRKRPGDRDQLILGQAKMDGIECHVVFATDPGQGGKVEFQESSKKLLCEGFTCKSDPMPGNKAKLTRFEPFSSACQNGLVRIVESTFPNKATLEHFYKSLEGFSGERSTRTYKDDLPDATASAFNYISKARIVSTKPRGQRPVSSLSSDMINENNRN